MKMRFYFVLKMNILFYVKILHMIEHNYKLEWMVHRAIFVKIFNPNSVLLFDVCKINIIVMNGKKFRKNS